MRPRPIRCTLVADGSSDACLVHPIGWLLRQLGWHQHQCTWADPRALPTSNGGLSERIRIALEYYPGELVFIHRDAEREPLENRVREIEAAVADQGRPLVHVCVVPVRMTEAWLLHDERAIRVAAGKPKGISRLEIPTSVRQFEHLADPKQTLRAALLTASEASGRTRKRKLRDFGRMRHRVAELIDDYSSLRALSAFERFERDLHATLAKLNP